MNDLDLCLQVVSMSRQPLRYIFDVEYVSETVRDRGLVPRRPTKEMAYGLSKGHVTLKSQTRDTNTLRVHISKIKNNIHIHISKSTRATDFKFGTRLCMGNAEEIIFPKCGSGKSSRSVQWGT